MADPKEIIINHTHTGSDSIIKVQQHPREGNPINYYSPNFCDPTSWYTNSTQVTDFIMTNSGDNLTYHTNGSHVGPWVDLKHGRMFGEDLILLADPSYAVVVQVSDDSGNSWESKLENSWGGTDGNYEVDYNNGEITFNSALNPTDIVKISFKKSPARFMWTFSPPNGKRLKLMYAECQFTTDVVMTSSMVYETWAYNPYDLPNKIKIAELKYKTFKDIAWEATGPYPTVPPLGGSERGTTSSLITMPFRYQAFRDVRSSYGIEVRVTSDKDGPYTGSFASATFYCLEENE